MDALELLLNRRSIAKLTEPAPQGQVLDNIIYAGMRAPDHGCLQPWHFVVIEGDGLSRFADILAQAIINDGDDQDAVEKARKAPFRAPMIIAVIARCQEHAKIPQWEQVITAGCAVQAMQMAAIAQGFSGIWRSGSWTEHPHVKAAFKCREQDKIVGFLYLGTPMTEPAEIRRPDLKEFVSYL